MLEAIGLLAIIAFIIWVIDLIFFKDAREERIREASSPQYTTVSRQCNQCLALISHKVKGSPQYYNIECRGCDRTLKIVIGNPYFNKCPGCGNTKRDCPFCGHIFEIDEYIDVPI